PQSHLQHSGLAPQIGTPGGHSVEALSETPGEVEFTRLVSRWLHAGEGDPGQQQAPAAASADLRLHAMPVQHVTRGCYVSLCALRHAGDEITKLGHAWPPVVTRAAGSLPRTVANR